MLPAIKGGIPIRQKENYLVFGEPYIGGEEIKEVLDTLKSCWIGTGPKVSKFENMIKDYLGVNHVIALNSCTAALHLSMIASGIRRGDEVITTPMTFCATANSILHAGAKPVFVDIDKNTLNIDVSKIEDAITEKTKAILPVHFAGRPCDINSISEIARKYNLLVIEDAAHALGAEYDGKKIGNFSDTTCFSFYSTKNITTIEGGVVATENSSIAKRIKTLALQGMSEDAWKRYSDEGHKHYFTSEPGFKYNMTDVQASLGIHQLPRIDDWDKRRIEIWNKYNKAFQDLPVEIPAIEEQGTKHARHLYILLPQLEKLNCDRDNLLQALDAEGIGTGVHYTALHLHPAYRRIGYKKGDFPNTEYVGDRTLSIPLSAKLTEKDVEDVISAITKILNYYKK